MQAEKLEWIAELRVTAEKLCASPSVCEARLGAALLEWLNMPSEFEHVLGIDFWQFGGSWRQKDSCRRRDSALRELESAFYADVGHWKAAGEIAASLASYRTKLSGWLKKQHLKAPALEDFGTEREHLWRALTARDECLGQKQIFRILNAGRRDIHTPRNVRGKAIASRR